MNDLKMVIQLVLLVMKLLVISRNVYVCVCACVAYNLIAGDSNLLLLVIPTLHGNLPRLLKLFCCGPLATLVLETSVFCRL